MASVAPSPVFSPIMFYKLLNPNLPDSSLSAGIFQDSQGAINLTTDGSLSSENWQLFAQSGRYFIRNYDYGPGYQLGLTDGSRSTPKLYPRSGKVEQQWSIVSANGGWVFVNGLWGNGTTFNLPKGWFMPAMGSGNGGDVWRVESNPSAATAKPLSGDWVSEVAGFEVLAPSPSPTPSSYTGTQIATLNPQSTAFISATPPPASGLPSSPDGLSSVAIAGIAIGSVAVIGALLLGIWLLLMRRKRRAANANPYELHGESRAVAETEKYAYRAELQQPVPELAGKRERVEMGGMAEATVQRVELEGDLGKSGEQQQR